MSFTRRKNIDGNRLDGLCRTILKSTAALACTVALASPALLQANQPFTQGNIVVVRVGDGTNAINSAARPVALVEYDSSGSIVQVIDLPTVTIGAQRRVVLAGNQTQEGALSLSGDGNYLTLIGYDAAPGTSDVSGEGVNPIIVRVGMDGVVDTSTRPGDEWDDIRAAITNDGSGFWYGGVDGGVYHTPFGGTSISQVSQNDDLTAFQIFDGQLYSSNEGNSRHGVVRIGTGLPTTGPQSETLLPGFPTSNFRPSDFFFASPTRIFLADLRGTGSGGGLQQRDLVAGSWALTATYTDGLSTGLRSTDGHTVGGDTMIYAVTSGASSNEIVRMTYPGAFTSFASPGSNYVFRGLVVLGDPISQTVVTGRVFHDHNGDGVQDPGEPGLEGVSVEVTDFDSNTFTVTTNVDGDYTANVSAAGDATVTVIASTLPPGSVLTTGNEPQVVTAIADDTVTADPIGYQQQVPEMTVTVAPGANSVGSGTTFTYTINFENEAPPSLLAYATNISIDFQLPFLVACGDQVTFEGASIGPGFTGSHSFDPITCIVTFTINEDIDPGESGFVTVTAKTLNPVPSAELESESTLFSSNHAGTPQPPAIDDAIVLAGDPLFVILTRFEAVLDGDTLRVEWETAGELDSIGFDVYRIDASDTRSTPVRINEVMIFAEGSPADGASYSINDPLPYSEGEVRGYLLLETEMTGRTIEYGPTWYPSGAITPDTGEKALENTSVQNWATY